MNYEIEGKLIVKKDIEKINDKFQKREFVIEVANKHNPNWSDLIKFQFVQDRCDMLDQVNQGDMVKVMFNIRGREWSKDGKVNYFVNLEAWRISDVEVVEEETVDDVEEAVQDDLPF